MSAPLRLLVALLALAQVLGGLGLAPAPCLAEEGASDCCPCDEDAAPAAPESPGDCDEGCSDCWCCVHARQPVTAGPAAPAQHADAPTTDAVPAEVARALPPDPRDILHVPRAA